MRRGLKRCLIVLALVAAVAVLPGNAFALQGLAVSGPIGGTDINQALIPPQGLYGAVVVGDINYKAWVNADESELDTFDSSQMVAVGLSYVWDAKIFGGSVMSSISMGYQDATWYMEGAGSDPDNYSGFSDIYSDLFYWGKFFPSEAFGTQEKGPLMRPFGLGLGLGFGVTMPTGTYEEGKANNMGTNQWTYSPSISLTYTMPSLLPKFFGDATQFSGRLFYNINGDQDDKKYKNGNVVNLDYCISQMKGSWQYGLTGAYYVQVTDDEFLDGHTGFEMETRTRMWSIGPLVAYNFTLNGHPFFAKAKYGYFLKGRNTSRTSVAFLVIGTKF